MTLHTKIRLEYPPALIDRPVVFQLHELFNLETNILRAHITGEEGWLILSLNGEETQYRQALGWLREQGIEVIEDVSESEGRTAP